MTAHLVHLTELAGSEISLEQLDRMVTRYKWAASYCDGKDVLEAGCGSGQGLNLLRAHARSLVGGDYAQEILDVARRSLPQIDLLRFDAQALPFPDGAFDVVILFEALYYVPDPEKFFREAWRVLRAGGVLLLASANKDLFDFNPSPHSFHYLGVRELARALGDLGFACKFFGDTRVDAISLRQRILRPVKYAAVRLGLMPKTSEGKLWLKRLVFGEMVQMPASIGEATRPYTPPEIIAADEADTIHKVILCAARKP